MLVIFSINSGNSKFPFNLLHGLQAGAILVDTLRPTLLDRFK